MSEAEKLQKIAQIMLEKEKKEKEVAALNRMIAEVLGISSTETLTSSPDFRRGRMSMLWEEPFFRVSATV